LEFVSFRKSVLSFANGNGKLYASRIFLQFVFFFTGDMMWSHKFRLAFLVAALAVAYPVRGQQISASPTQLALEVHFYPNQAPSFQPVPDSSHGGTWYGRFGRVAGWEPPANSKEVTAVNIRCVKAEDGVRVWVSVFLGQLHEEETKVTAYVLHEGDKVTVQELAQFGVVPFDIKIVRLAALTGDPPQFSSRAKSIELVSMQPNFSVTPSYEVVLRNTSGKAANALEVRTSQASRPGITMMPQGHEGQALILPGGTYKMTVYLAERTTAGSNGYAPEILPNQTIEVSAAVFDDGSLEGDSSSASAFIGFQKGRKAQLARVVEVLQSALNGDAGAPSDFAAMKNAMATLGLQADDAAVTDLRAKFPQEAQQRLRHVIELGMKGIRDDVLNNLTQFELHNRRTDASAFSAWLTATKNHYESWLARL
jgi:hypothetical protein